MIAVSWPAEALKASRIAYPIVNALHIVALATLFGSIAVLDLSILLRSGASLLIHLARLVPKIAGTGLVAAIATGFMLFSVQPFDYAANSAFRLKLIVVAIGTLHAAAHAGDAVLSPSVPDGCRYADAARFGGVFAPHLDSGDLCRPVHRLSVMRRVLMFDRVCSGLGEGSSARLEARKNVGDPPLTVDRRHARRGMPIALALSLAVLFFGSEPGRAVDSLDDLLHGAMGDAALTTAFAGRHLEGVYSDATHWSESYGADGTLSYRDRQGDWPGDWTVRSARFCTFYRTGELNGGCFLVARRGKNCFDFYAVGSDLTPGVTRGDIASGTNWTARGWYVEAEPSCPEEKRKIVGL